MPQYFNMDANEQLFFARQLEHVKSQTYDIKYPELKARRLIPTNFDVPRGAKTITYRQYDMVGMAKIVANYATDFPKVTVKGKEFTSPVKRLGDSYSYTIDDIQAAIMSNMNLDARELMTAKRGILQKENQVAFFGDSVSGLPGFFTNPNIPVAAAPATGIAGSPLWSQKTPDIIIQDVSSCINTIKTQSNGVELPTAMLFPVSAMATLTTTPRSSTDNTLLINFLKAAHPYITLWEELVELETAGVGGTRMMVAYKRDPMALTHEVPEDFTAYPAQEKGLEYEIPCSSKTGGTIVYYPLSANMLYGF